MHPTCALLCLRHGTEMFIQEAMSHRLFYNKGYQYLRHEEREDAGGGGLGSRGLEVREVAMGLFQMWECIKVFVEVEK